MASALLAVNQVACASGSSDGAVYDVDDGMPTTRSIDRAALSFQRRLDLAQAPAQGMPLPGLLPGLLPRSRI
jgi:hypothetical protein